MKLFDLKNEASVLIIPDEKGNFIYQQFHVKRNDYLTKEAFEKALNLVF